MKRINYLILTLISITFNCYSQECNDNNIFLSYNQLFLNNKYLAIKDNATNQITMHKYSNTYNYSLKFGYLYHNKKINYGFYVNYSSLDYRLNYFFNSIEYDPYLLDYSIIYAKYMGLSTILGKCVMNKNAFRVNINLFFENNYLIQNSYKHVFNNKKYTTSNEILYKQEIKKYLPVIGYNVEIKQKIFKKINMSLIPAVFYSLKKISDVSIQKKNIQFSASIQLGYEI